MKTLTFSNGKTIPALGFGTWRLANKITVEMVETAIKAGYRHIDAAAIYGNEKEVGQGIKNAIEHGLVTREELFVTSKLWNTEHAPKDVAKACQQSLEDLGLEYVDLYLMHWGVGWAGFEEPIKLSFVPLADTWHAMEKLVVGKGLVKSIGVANFTGPMLIDLLSYAKVKPVMNQVELNPYNAQNGLVKFCHDQNIAVTAYSPFGSDGAPILSDVTIGAIAKKYNCTPAQIALKWSLQRDVAVIPKSSSEQRVKENFDIDGFELTDKDMQAIDALDQHKRFVDPDWGFPYF